MNHGNSVFGGNHVPIKIYHTEIALHLPGLPCKLYKEMTTRLNSDRTFGNALVSTLVLGIIIVGVVPGPA